MLTQLNPMIPVFVVPNPRMPTGEALAFALLDYSAESQMLWGCAFQVGGEVWWVPNELIRFRFNASLGRIPETK